MTYNLTEVKSSHEDPLPRTKMATVEITIMRRSQGYKVGMMVSL
jgi:hypothetical protein